MCLRAYFLVPKLYQKCILDPSVTRILSSVACISSLAMLTPVAAEFLFFFFLNWASQVGSVVKNLPANAGDTGLIPGSRRSPGEGNSNPLPDTCLGNPMDRECGVAKKSDTTWRLNNNS